MQFITTIKARFSVASSPVGLFVLLFLNLVLFSSYKPYFQEPSNSEYQVKAFFLYNFTQFIEWPDSAFANQTAPFVIGIVDDDPIEKYLTEAVQGEYFKSHPLVVQRIYSPQDVKNCHMLFISKRAIEKFPDIINQINKRNILTIADIKGFAKMGGMIEFVKKDNKIHLIINQNSTKDARLHVSSKLLRLAETL